MTDWLDHEDTSSDTVHASLPVLVGRVVGLRFPIGHYKLVKSKEIAGEMRRTAWWLAR